MSFSPIEFLQKGLERERDGLSPSLSFPSVPLLLFCVSACVCLCVGFTMDTSQQIVNSSPPNCLHLSKVCVQSRRCDNTECLCDYSRFCVCVCEGRERERAWGIVCCRSSMVSSLCTRLHKPSFLDGHTNAPTHSQTEMRTLIFREENGGGGSFVFSSSEHVAVLL